MSFWFMEMDKAPRTKVEAQRMTNHQVVSVRYAELRGERYIRSFSTWDGESYVSKHFCADTTCGVRYAYYCAEHRKLPTA